jgi:hypothetical protein
MQQSIPPDNEKQMIAFAIVSFLVTITILHYFNLI